MTRELMMKSTETWSDIRLNEKCRELTNIYSRNKLLQITGDIKVFDYLFTSNILSMDEVNYALVKKYYLANCKNSELSEKLHDIIEEHAFEQLDRLLINDSKVRAEMVGTFIDHINTSNTTLISDKLIDEDYEQMGKTLDLMKTFYQQKKITPIQKKKSIKNL